MTIPDRSLTIGDISRVVSWMAREALRGTYHAVCLGAILGGLIGLGPSREPLIFALAGAFWGMLLGPCFGLARGWMRLAESNPGRHSVVARAAKSGGIACLVIFIPCGVVTVVGGADPLAVVLSIFAVATFGSLLGLIVALTSLAPPPEEPVRRQEDSRDWSLG